MDEPVKVEYQLRRIGKPATLPTVKDVFRLTKDVTRFGRHSCNDQFLDSSKLNHFISRWHAEIQREEKEGKTCFIIQDKSLNGTYVNHVRVKGNYTLKEGDVVLFGHTNGKHIKPGQRYMQVESEFKFVFEEVRPPPADIFIDLSTDNEGDITAPVSPVIPLVGDHNRQAPYNSSQETPSSQSSRPASVSRRLLPGSGSSIVLKDISNTGVQPQGLVSLDSLIPRNCLVQNHENEVNDVSSLATVPPPNSSPSLPTQASLPSNLLTSTTTLLTSVPTMTTSTLLDDSSIPATTSLSFAVHQPVSTYSLPQIPDSTTDDIIVTDDVISQALDAASGFRGSSSEDDLLNTSLNVMPPAEASSSLVSSTAVPLVANHELLNNVVESPTPFPPVEVHAANRLISHTIVAPPPVGSSKSNSASAGKGKRTTAKKANPSQGKTTAKRRDSNSSINKEKANNKRKKGPKLSQPKRKKTKFALPTDEDRRNLSSDDEDWYSWHADGDTCAAPLCGKPAGLKVDWVQCDDCDEWYHTICAGCNYSAVKDTDAEFHCGCK